MNFKFSLQRILNLREQETQEAELKLEKTRNIIADLRKMVHQERDMYFDERDELNQNLKTGNLSSVKIYERSLLLRQERIIELLDNIRTYQADLEVLQQILIQSKRNQKILENLRDLKKKEFFDRETAKEQRMIDEIGSQKYIRAQINEKGEE
ncbi:flagellar export protein FliJ [Pigmentibacter sp. JX0631]|uniref:flagellar export protein FliJ n=1 Tax=Pigmentibacter sp. JX0631 TaxID=2976982 RepID=UPI0024683AFA|nr:flagellar export protein FliJ [Pigmentibacter sp. JX0631]WGL59455.1 flagellar export protein FliJ [Pigmentibacter sp. JX0631]